MKGSLPCLASCRHRTSSHLSAARFLGEKKKYLVVALCGIGATHVKPSVVARSALGQPQANEGSVRPEDLRLFLLSCLDATSSPLDSLGSIPSVTL